MSSNLSQIALFETAFILFIDESLFLSLRGLFVRDLTIVVESKDQPINTWLALLVVCHYHHFVAQTAPIVALRVEASSIVVPQQTLCSLLPPDKVVVV